MELIAFADTNLFLDAFLGRNPHDVDCIKILSLAKENRITLYTSSSCVLTIMYFLKKDGMSREDIITIISQLFVFISLVSAGEQTFKKGLSTDFSDLEDAIQYYTALDVRGIDYFITSNIKDYKRATAQLPVVTPKQFLSKLKV